MEMIQTHDCQNCRVEKLATGEEPFHFTDSGLPNVYLIGIKYFNCECGSVVAEIPAPKQLMRLIARDLVESPQALTGDEIRFLRKRLGKKASDFARDLGVEPETLSRMENGKQSSSEQLDKLIRLLYAMSANDPELLERVRMKFDSWIASWSKQHSDARIVKRIDDNEWTNALAA